MVKTRRYKRARVRSYKRRRATMRRQSIRRSLRRKTKVGGWGMKMFETGGRKDRQNNLASQYNSSLYGGWGEPLVSP